MTNHKFEKFYCFSESILCFKLYNKVEIIKPKLLNYSNGLPQTKGFDLAYIKQNWIFRTIQNYKVDYHGYDNVYFILMLNHLRKCYDLPI